MKPSAELLRKLDGAWRRRPKPAPAPAAQAEQPEHPEIRIRIVVADQGLAQVIDDMVKALIRQGNIPAADLCCCAPDEKE